MKGAEDKPLLVLQRQDKGRVALLLSDDTWLWARGYEGGGPQVDLLRRLAHWLMKEPDLEEEALRAKARGGDLTVERQTMADTTTPVTVTKPSGATETLTLDRRRAGPVAGDHEGRRDRPLPRRAGRQARLRQRRPGQSARVHRRAFDRPTSSSRWWTRPTAASPAWRMPPAT